MKFVEITDNTHGCRGCRSILRQIDDYGETITPISPKCSGTDTDCVIRIGEKYKVIRKRDLTEEELIKAMTIIIKDGV